jgi:hypothetical protein
MATSEEIDSLIARLAAIPARLAQAVEGWSESRLYETSDEGGWSAAEVLAHIRACDDINGYRPYAILARDNPPLVGYDETRWVSVVGYAQAGFHTSLKTFAYRRAELVDLLRRCSPADWERSGIHEEYGPISILKMVTHIAGHEEEHCAQIEALRSFG